MARDPKELWCFLTQNLSLPNSTAQAFLAAQVDLPEVRQGEHRQRAHACSWGQCLALASLLYPPLAARGWGHAGLGSQDQNAQPEPRPLPCQVYRLLFHPLPALDVDSGLPRSQEPWGRLGTSSLFRLEVRAVRGTGGCYLPPGGCFYIVGAEGHPIDHSELRLENEGGSWEFTAGTGSGKAGW